jgi:hypothetical protein
LICAAALPAKAAVNTAASSPSLVGFIVLSMLSSVPL